MIMTHEMWAAAGFAVVTQKICLTNFGKSARVETNQLAEANDTADLAIMRLTARGFSTHERGGCIQRSGGATHGKSSLVV